MLQCSSIDRSMVGSGPLYRNCMTGKGYLESRKIAAPTVAANTAAMGAAWPALSRSMNG
jgi:hypothetical protein